MSDFIPEMIGIRETAKRTGLSYNCLRRLCLRDEIPCIRIGSPTKGVFKINYTALCRILNGEEEHINEKRSI